MNDKMYKYDELIKRLRAAAIMSDALSVFLPHSEGSAVAKLYNEAADAIEAMSKSLDDMNEANIALYGALPKWIPVTERLPEPSAVDERGFAKAYLVKTDRNVMMHTARWNGMYWILWGKSTTLTDKVTHWMPLPPPEEV